MIISNRLIKILAKAAVSAQWEATFANVLSDAGIDVDFCTDGEGLTRRLADDWTVDVVILDLALATPGLAARLSDAGPPLLAFGAPDNAGIALAANLADFIPDMPIAADLIAAIQAAAAVDGPVGVAELSDRSVARLGALGAEATRIANALAQLAPGPTSPPPLDHDRLRAMIRARRLRDRFFPPDLFGEPAWDMLLDLAVASVEGRDVAVSSLCIAAAVPTTTALRWVRALCDAGLFERRDDPRDARRAFISLSEPATAAMARYLAQAGS